MRAEELKNSAIFEALRKNKEAQQSALALGKTKDWRQLKQFVAGLKQTLLEATLGADSLNEIRRYRFLIRGMESIVLLPSLVEFVKKQDKEDKARKEEKEKEAKRRKYNPGAFIRRVTKKVKGKEVK